MRSMLKLAVCVGFAAVMLTLATLAQVWAQAADTVTLRTDWLPLSYHAPFHLAKERGYYKVANIELTIFDGRGSGNTIQLIGNGEDTFGLAEASVVAKAVGQGVPVKMIMGILRRSAAGIVWPAKNNIQSPADLKGKKITMCAGEATALLLEPYLKAVNLASTDIELVAVDCAAKYIVVAQGSADAVLGYAPFSRQQFLALGIDEIGNFAYSDAGVVVPATGVIAALKTIASKPDLVRRFIAASKKGWADALKDPDEAFKVMAQAIPAMKDKEQVLRREFDDYRPYFESPGTKGKPFGWQSQEDWQRAEAIWTQYMGIKSQPSVDAFFTNEFVSD